MVEEEYKMMNNANMAFALGQMQSARESIHFDGSYIVEIDGELHTLSELVDFWRQYNNERNTKKETELSTKQRVERVQASEKRGAEGDRPYNEKEIVQGGKSSSQKPKGRRIRKPQ